MGVDVDVALESRLSDAKNALCRSRAVMLKVVNKSRTQKFRRSLHNEKKKQDTYPNYGSWSKDELIARIRELEVHKHAKSTRSLSHTPNKPFHFSSYPKRKIAIKFCYSGWEYNGLACQNSPTPLPTVLFKVFVKARLVDETDGFDGCGWDKCGRTDRGVSAAGQVVSLWVRKILFTSHGLDISVMQSAANRLVESGKQITNFHRRVIRAQISPVSPESDGNKRVYVFDPLGSAFLYHQVQHIMAVLFLVGTGLVEQPSVISVLMNVFPAELNSLPKTQLPLVDRKPEYQMADALPLMLWDWNGASSDLYYRLHSIHQCSLIHVTLDEYFLTPASKYHSPPPHTLLHSNLGREPVLGVPLGAGTYKRGAKYVPLLERKRLDHVDVANER
ncbi:pseudouridine synthase [Suillus decipiens]|nr:pseudouridine synthase [Suillus decipiens]